MVFPTCRKMFMSIAMSNKEETVTLANIKTTVLLRNPRYLLNIWETDIGIYLRGITKQHLGNTKVMVLCRQSKCFISKLVLFSVDPAISEILSKERVLWLNPGVTLNYSPSPRITLHSSINWSHISKSLAYW